MRKLAAITVGAPEGTGWFRGLDLARPEAAPLAEVLERMRERSPVGDRKTIAASFLLRFAWSAAAPLAAWLSEGLVLDMPLARTRYRFGPSGLFERVAFAEPPGDVRGDLSDVRARLIAQAEPVVEACHEWSRMSRRGLWGQLAANWGGLLVSTARSLGDDRRGREKAERFFAEGGMLAPVRPRFVTIDRGGKQRTFHVAAACCRYYLAPEGRLCATCPLLDEEARRVRFVEAMEKAG